jgi:signal transduction histidine kinase
VLWDGIVFNITEGKEREREISESRQLLRELSAHRESAREEERKRIAREIHDELGQVLTALKMDLAYLNMNLGEVHPKSQATVKSMEGLIDRAVESVRSIATALRPGVLDLGLAAAIEWQAQEFQARTGIPCEVRLEHQDIALDDGRSTAVFRILQESLTNVARHAEASRVRIILEKTDGLLKLEVADDGKGVVVDQVNKAKSFGLLGIKERTAILGGTLDIRSAPGEGTALSVSVPV